MTSVTTTTAKAAETKENKNTDIVLAYTTLKHAIGNLRRHGKRLGHVVNPLHFDRHASSNDEHDIDSESFQVATNQLARLSRSEQVVVVGQIDKANVVLEGMTFSLNEVNPSAEPFVRYLKVSPFGDLHTGTTTVDKSVRDAREITSADAKCIIDASDDDSKELFETLFPVFGTGITLEFDKINVYREGGHFTSHVDTPSPGVVGSLVVVLEHSEFTGGELVIRHAGQETVFTGQSDNFVAFYASCEHEVRPVTSGTRVSLAFKIKAAPTVALEPRRRPAIDLFVDQLELAAREARAAKVGVFMTHDYSLGAASREELVGVDRELFAVIKSRFPETELTSVMAMTSYSRWEDCKPRFSNIVFRTSRDEIERLGELGVPRVESFYGDFKVNGIPFIRACGL
jgi:hypothetical protein